MDVRRIDQAGYFHQLRARGRAGEAWRRSSAVAQLRAHLLQPAVKDGIFDLWVDRHMTGGAKWEKEIEDKLRACDIFILLVSANSMASNYIVDKEIAIIRERQAKGDDVHFYPLLLRPTPKVALDKVRDFNLRPRDAKPFLAYPVADREQHMTEAANEIAEIAERIVKQKAAAQPSARSVQPAYVHITGLPETAYERLVGRDTELKRLACGERVGVRGRFRESERVERSPHPDRAKRAIRPLPASGER